MTCNSMTKQMLLVLPLLLLTAFASGAVELVSAQARALSSVSSVGGYSIIPAGTEPASYGDLAPVQLFEIVKPDGQSVTISRMFTSCTCVQLEADKRTYGPGERAILRLKNIIATPPSGLKYALYIQFANPAGITLRYDTFVQSSQFVPATDGNQPTRGNIVADGVLSPSTNVDLPGGASLDVIVPKAENYIPDTSEYTLRKQAESKKQEKETTTKPDTVKDGLDKNLLKEGKDGPKTAPHTSGKPVKPLDRNLLDPGSQPQTEEAAKPAENHKPSPQKQLGIDVDAAITRVERTLNSGVATPGAASQYGAPVFSENYSTSQAQPYQVEARQIGQTILNPPVQPRPQQVQNQQRPALPNTASVSVPAQPAAPMRNAEEFADKALAEQDGFWRVPRPRGNVRTTGSLSRQSQQAPAVPLREAARSAQSTQQNVVNTVKNQAQSFQETMDAANLRAAESLNDVINTPIRTSNKP